MTYRTYIEKASPEIAANTAICLIHQTNYLLRSATAATGKIFPAKGGFTERLYRERKKQITVPSALSSVSSQMS
jgi:four helix bundle suffix protein